MSELFATISKLVVRNEFSQAVMDMGGIHLILQAFQDSIANKVGTLPCTNGGKGGWVDVDTGGKG